MKKTLFLLLITAFGLNMNAKGCDTTRTDNGVRTIFNDAKLVGGYVGISTRGFEINNHVGFGLGGEVALVMGRKFNIGFSGYALGTDVPSPYVDANGYNYFYDMAYGGFYVEPMIGSKWPVHFTFPVTLGAGGVSQSRYRIYDELWHSSYDADWFFVAEAGANVELNLFKFMRIAGGVNYRLTSDVYLLGGSKQQLSGLGANVTLKLGWF